MGAPWIREPPPELVQSWLALGSGPRLKAPACRLVRGVALAAALARTPLGLRLVRNVSYDGV